MEATVLIVDDEPIVLDLLSSTLAAPGRRIITATDAREAKSQAEGAASLEVALVDKNLPDATGLQLVRDLRQRHGDVACVLMTAYPSTDSAAEAVRLALFDYVVKPFGSLAEVETMVGRAIGEVHKKRDEKERHRLLEAQVRLTPPAERDPLTGVLTRDAFIEHVGRALGAARAGAGREFAVLVMDLNGLGRINDSLGHAAGDRILKQWTDRVLALIRPEDVLARFAGDQFIALLPGVQHAQEAMDVVGRISRLCSQPFAVEGREVSLGVSAGINLSALGYEAAGDLLRDAGAALARAKDERRGGQVVFTRDMHARAVELLTLDRALDLAIARGELTAHYQPIISLETNRLVGFEALARWQHPERGLLHPDQFIGRAAETGRLAEVSWQVVERACSTQRRWIDRYGARVGLTLSLNVAPTLLARPTFLQELDRLVSRYALEPQRLKIEVTEAVAIDNTVASAEIIQALRRLGYTVCLDDFGTGYASLAWLHRFPVDEIKIDKSFVASMVDDRRSQILVGAAVSLAHALGLPVVAEGIEQANQLDELRALSCEYGQGYFFARPLTEQDAEALLIKELDA